MRRYCLHFYEDYEIFGVLFIYVQSSVGKKKSENDKETSKVKILLQFYYCTLNAIFIFHFLSEHFLPCLYATIFQNIFANKGKSSDVIHA